MDDETDFYEDIDITAGATLSWSFDIEPLDLSSCTASFVAPALGTFTPAISVFPSGITTTSRLTLTVDAATTATWTKNGIFDYQIFVTFPDSSIWAFGHGKVLVQ